TQQLDSSHSEDSIDLLSGGPVALPYNPAPLNTAITPLLSALPETTPVKSGYGIQGSGNSPCSRKRRVLAKP
ncbi:hypothetical protein KUCAC02_009829, partial [Chaenocephalus aceratus]